MVDSTLPQAPKSEARRRLAELVRAELSRFVGLRPSDPLPESTAFLDLGFDSLRAVDFKTLLEERLGTKLRSTVLYDCPTLGSLVEFLLDSAAASAAPELSAAAQPRPKLEELSREALIEALQQAERRLEATIERAHAPIAIVGMACRFPGAGTLEEFWALQRDGKDAIGPVPRGRWSTEAWYDPDPNAPGKMSVREGGFIEDIELFDADFFNISPREARALDPQQRLLLEVAWEALENAGIAPDRLGGHPAGVFIGLRESEYFVTVGRHDVRHAELYVGTGNALSTAAGRVSFTLGLTGPAISVDTACSSSLVAVHLAVQSLRRGESRLALVGGVNALLDPLGMVSLSKGGMLSPDSRCKTFAAGANGYVRSEGAAMVVLKTLAEAEADGDRVLGLILGAAVNQDGQSGGLTVPFGPAQEAVIRAALSDARVSPGEVSYVEAHGTGTALGDPIEMGAIDRVFRGRKTPLAVGTIKTNIGHLETAAGIAGLVRTILALNAQTIPGILHLKTKSPHIPWGEICATVPERAEPWIPSGPRRIAGISSFGFSGTNAHLVVAEAPASARLEEEAPSEDVMFFSAKTEPALAELIRARAKELPGLPDARFADACFTSRAGRAGLEHRIAVTAADLGDLKKRLDRAAAGAELPGLFRGKAAGDPPPIAFLYTGQGAQHAGMGQDLAERSPVFRRALEEAEAALAPHLPGSLRERLWGGASAELSETHWAQPALFALEVALAALWKSYGITPSVVLGHSVGELAAAVTAGLLSLEDGARLVAARGLAMTEHCPPGAMITVFGPPEVVGPVVAAQGDAAAISGYNGPANLTVAGTPAALEAISAALGQAGVSTRKVVASRAFHTPHMAPMLPTFDRALAGVSFAAPQIDLISTAFPEQGAAAFAEPSYFSRQILAPVRFVSALSALYHRGYRSFVEIGPKPTLSTLGKDVLADPTVRFFPSLRPGRDARSQILECASQLWVRGATLDVQRFLAEGRQRIALSSYPFQRRRYWYESASEARGGGAADHPLLGGRLRSPALDAARLEHQSAISAEAPAWLADHAVAGRALFPAAGFVELGLAALAERHGRVGLSVSGLRILEPLPLGATSVELSTSTVQSGGGWRLEIATLSAEEARWTTHATAQLDPVELAPRKLDLEALGGAIATSVDVAGLYERLAALGLDYGPAFRGIERLRIQGPEALAWLRLPEAAGTGEGYLLHPALLDACFQVSAAILSAEGQEGRALPVAIERVNLYSAPGPAVVCHLSRRDAGSQRSFLLDLELATPRGELVAEVLGLELLRVDEEAVDGRALLERWAYSTEWRTAPPVEARARGPLWLLPDEGGVAQALAAELGARGAEVLVQLARPSVRPAAIVCCASLDAREGDAKRALAPLVALAKMEWGEGAPRLYVLTAPGGANASAQASVAGLLASWAAEGSAHLPTRLEIEAPLSDADRAAVAQELLADDPEQTVQLTGGERRVSRLVRGLGHPHPPLAPRLPEGPWQIRTSAYGQLGNLRFVPLLRRPPGPGEVEVELAASALNFRDVLHALGMLEAFSRSYGVTRAEEQPFGFDAVGRISAVSEGARFSVGQRVMVLGLGTAASHITVDARQVAVAPAPLSDADVAALPTAYLTALLGLLRLARLQPGERVLIHGAAGGVGQAAVMVAKRAGARIYATAHPRKHALLRSMGLSEVYSSRDLAFEEAISRATQGQGVEVVLNSLSGPALDASLRLLARGGRFVEIGKLGILSAEEVAARRPDAAYLPFDLGMEARRDPGLLPSLFAELNAALAEGSLSRLPVSAYSALDAVSAFSLVARSGHLGKVVLSHRTPLRPERSTLITGGLGALGLVAAKALVGAGASKVALLGRSPPSPEATAAIGALEAQGATVQILQGDVSSRADLRRALAAIPDLGGVIHAAGVLDDGAAQSLDLERLGKVLAPKLEGARLLREFLADRSLDFFLSYSSASAVLGAAGQAAYAAANAALAKEMALERQSGRPGLALAFGAWGEQGMAAKMPEPLKRRLRDGGLREIAPSEGAALLLAVLARGAGAAEVALLPVHWPRFLARPGVPVGAFLEGFRAAAAPKQARGPSAAALRARLAAAEAGERPEIIADLLATELAAVIGLGSKAEVDTSRKLSTMGVDSLLAVDLRNRLESALGHKLPASLLFDHPTIDELALHLSRALDQSAAPAAAPAASAPASAPVDAAPNEALSEEELSRRLEAQLSRLGR